MSMIGAIESVGESINADKTIRAVVLSGEGEYCCSGLDKSNFISLLEGVNTSLEPNKQEGSKNDKSKSFKLSDRTHGISNVYQNIVWMWRQLPMPVIFAVNGVTFGGGLQIALGGDFRYASKGSKFSIFEMNWGLIPDMGSTQIMRHLVRDDVIRELTYTGREFSADQAKEWGFITEVVDDPVAHALDFAYGIANNSPDAIRAAKHIIEAANYQSVEEGLLMESLEQDKILGKANQVEAVVSRLNKRQPTFKD